MTAQSLQGRTVLVAAGGKNLGGLISRQLAEAGADVAIHYNSESSRAEVEQTLRAVESAGRGGVLLQGDLTVPAQVEQLFADATGSLGPIDVAVNAVVTSLLAAFTDGYSTYAGAKSPVEHFTRAAAKEFAGRGISVNGIAPGSMDTPFFYPEETPERVEFHRSMAMGGRLTRIEDIAPIVRFLATEGHWVTGQTIFANGGYTTR